MFQVQPVRSPDLQAQLAGLLHCPCHEGCYAFFAGELSDDAREITALIALCQFSFAPEKAVIRSLAWTPGSDDDEALIILVRAVMSWLWRADIPAVEFADTTVPEEFVKKLGFRPTDGLPTIDLDRFFRSPCAYNQAESGDPQV